MTWRDQLTHYRQIIDEFLFGATLSWTLVPILMRRRQETEHIIALMLLMQNIGMPLLPPAYALKLLPYLIPNLLYWRRMTIFDQVLEGADLRHLGH